MVFPVISFNNIERRAGKNLQNRLPLTNQDFIVRNFSVRLLSF